MPRDMRAHGERCSGALPTPHPLSTWLTRLQALQYVTAPALDRWRELGLIRMRVDGALLERDVALISSWMRALEVPQ